MSKMKFTTDKAPIPNGAIAQAVILPNGMAYLSGQISQDTKTGEIIRGSVSEQTDIILTNIKTIVNEMGAEMDDVVKCTCFVSSMEEVFEEFDKTYRKYFSEENPPVRHTFAAKIWKDLDVEISCELLLPNFNKNI